jgi:hypothetical protein
MSQGNYWPVIEMWPPSGLGAKRGEQRARIQPGNDLARKAKKALVERGKNGMRLCTSSGLYLGGDAPSESASSAGLRPKSDVIRYPSGVNTSDFEWCGCHVRRIRGVKYLQTLATVRSSEVLNAVV